MWEGMEVWADIVGYPNYQVSTQGNVRNINTGRLLKGREHDGGYRNVYIKDMYGKYRNQYIHRLVATYFVPSDPDCDEVDHINRDKTDNRADNLRWVDRSTNSKNYCRKNRRGYKMNTLTALQQEQIKHFIFEGESNVKISERLDIPRQTIYSYRKRLEKTNEVQRQCGGSDLDREDGE